jgi:hypothetical protein
MHFSGYQVVAAFPHSETMLHRQRETRTEQRPTNGW